MGTTPSARQASYKSRERFPRLTSDCRRQMEMTPSGLSHVGVQCRCPTRNQSLPCTWVLCTCLSLVLGQILSVTLAAVLPVTKGRKSCCSIAAASQGCDEAQGGWCIGRVRVPVEKGINVSFSPAQLPAVSAPVPLPFLQKLAARKPIAPYPNSPCDPTNHLSCDAQTLTVMTSLIYPALKICLFNTHWDLGLRSLAVSGSHQFEALGFETTTYHSEDPGP